MAAASFVSLSLQPKPEVLLVSSSHSCPWSISGRSSSSIPRRSPFHSPSKAKYPILITSSSPSSSPSPSESITSSSSSSSPSPSESPKPQIELEFVGPKAGADGSYPVDMAWEISGEKLLRNIMLENKIDLYATYGKVMNCGGGGSCGTCIVEIIDGKDLLNERTDTEKQYLKKKPESWRLACQTIVGNKENAGKVVVQRLPQWKK